MPRLNATIPARAPTRVVPANGYYPKLLQGDSGSVWLVTGPSGKRDRSYGTIVYLSGRPQKASHKIGYHTDKINEAKMKVFKDPVTLAFAD